jgi:hypothetical protein
VQHYYAMSILAAELDERLQQLDPRTAAHVERLIREALALTESVPAPPDGGRSATGLMALAEAAEPMGVLSNREIDACVYGQ